MHIRLVSAMLRIRMLRIGMLRIGRSSEACPQVVSQAGRPDFMWTNFLKQ
jgi:hypothetical protein